MRSSLDGRSTDNSCWHVARRQVWQNFIVETCWRATCSTVARPTRNFGAPLAQRWLDVGASFLRPLRNGGSTHFSDTLVRALPIGRVRNPDAKRAHEPCRLVFTRKVVYTLLLCDRISPAGVACLYSIQGAAGGAGACLYSIIHSTEYPGCYTTITLFLLFSGYIHLRFALQNDAPCATAVCALGQLTCNRPAEQLLRFRLLVLDHVVGGRRGLLVARRKSARVHLPRGRNTEIRSRRRGALGCLPIF